MSIDQTDKIDFSSIDKVTGDLLLTISDHLPWDKDEGAHLILLQEKLNAYLRFVESGEIYDSIPNSRGKNVVINLIGKFPLSQQASLFFNKAENAVKDAGFQLRFSLIRPN